MEDCLNRTVVSDIKVTIKAIQVNIIVLVLIFVKDIYVFPETYYEGSVWTDDSFKSVPSIFHFVNTANDILRCLRQLSIIPFTFKDIITRTTIVQTYLTISITFTIGNTVGNQEEDGLALVSHATFISVILCDSVFDSWNCWSSSCYADVVNEAMDSAFIRCQARRLVLIVILLTPTRIYSWLTCKVLGVIIVISIRTLEASHHNTVRCIWVISLNQTRVVLVVLFFCDKSCQLFEGFFNTWNSVSKRSTRIL